MSHAILLVKKKTPLEPLIPSFKGTFDVVSCQFALHYSFETEARARQGLQNISLALRDGGLFLGTLPHANWIVKKLRSIDGLSFGNPLFSISFEQKDDYPLFGHTYKFALMDAIDDCPEYLVNFPTLKRYVLSVKWQDNKRAPSYKLMNRLASEYGLECVAAHPFHDFVYDKMQNQRHLKLMETMQVFDANGQFSRDCWEVAGVYMTFVFKKLPTS
jgi:mRNA (guanine-N7-)-methyltransferase